MKSPWPTWLFFLSVNQFTFTDTEIFWKDQQSNSTPFQVCFAVCFVHSKFARNSLFIHRHWVNFHPGVEKKNLRMASYYFETLFTADLVQLHETNVGNGPWTCRQWLRCHPRSAKCLCVFDGNSSNPHKRILLFFWYQITVIMAESEVSGPEERWVCERARLLRCARAVFWPVCTCQTLKGLQHASTCKANKCAAG